MRRSRSLACALSLGLLGLWVSLSAQTTVPPQTNLVRWYKADAANVTTTTVTSNALSGPGVSSWADLSPSNLPAVQSTGNGRLLWNPTDASLEANDIWDFIQRLRSTDLNLDRQSFSVYFLTTDLLSVNYANRGRRNLFASLGGASLSFHFAGSTADGDTTLGKLGVYDGTTYQYASALLPSSPSLLGLVCGASNCKIITNGTVDTVSALPAGTVNGVVWAAAEPGGTPSFRLDGGLREILVYSATHTDADIANTQNYARYRGARFLEDVRNVVIGLGDSISIAANSMLNRGYQRQLRATLPPMVEYSLAYPSKLSQWATDIPGGVLTPYITAAAGRKITLFSFLGTNDIANDSISGATTFTRLTTVTAAIRTAGIQDIIVGTMLPRGSGTTLQTPWTDYNAAIRADGLSHFSAIADCGGDAALGVWGAQDNTVNFHTDKIHLLDPGFAICAPYFANALRSFMLHPTMLKLSIR